MNARASIDELVKEVMAPPARGRRPRSCAAAISRQLTREDILHLGTLQNGDLESEASPIKRIRSSHHMLARLLAEGRKEAECQLITGYSSSYVSVIKHDPGFKELLAHYKSTLEEVYVNVHERLQSLGLDSVEELQARLAEEPDSFSTRELIELASFGMDRAGHGPQSRVKHDHNLGLSPEIMEQLKNEISSRSAGQIRPLPQSSSRLEGGGPILDLPVAEAETSKGSERQGSDV